MHTTTRFALISVLALASCNKESEPAQPAPVADFSVVGDASNDVIRVGTYDAIRVTNTSANTKVTSYTWTLGNDSTKTGADPGLIRYPKAGTYLLTLTAQGNDGQKTSVSRTVRVLDRVLKQVVILNTRFENTPTPHTFVRPTVQAVLRLGPDKVSYPTPSNQYTSYNAPILFQSPSVSNFTDDQLPYIFPVTDRLVLSLPALEATLRRSELGYTGVGYGLELYVQDATGTYLASSSYQTRYYSQVGSITWQSDIPNNKFIARYSNIELRCQYE